MQKILFFFLSMLKTYKRFIWSLQGKKESDIQEDRIVSGKAWDDFCDQLKLAGATLNYPGTPQDVFSQSEGIRYLTRLTRAGLEAYVEYGDPDFPVLRRMVHETVKLGADNPDNYYFNAQIDGRNEYRIKGKRNSIHYLGFFTQNGGYGSTGGLAPCGVLQGSDLQLDNDGNFEIILSKEERGSNWLKIEEDTSLVIVRQTFYSREAEVPAELFIETINKQKAPAALSPQRLEEGLKMASMFVAGAPLLFTRWAKGFKNHVNTLPQFDPEVSNKAGGDADIIYYHSYWKLDQDEVLRIRVKPPECDNWNFQLNNYWMESLDYRYHTVCINKGSAVLDPDGRVTILVSHRDPGKPNWIETCDHFEGTMCWRWYRLTPGQAAISPDCEVVKFTSLN